MSTVKLSRATVWQKPVTDFSKWSLFFGGFLIVIGVLAVLMPFIAALASTLILAWLLILAGSLELIHSIQTRSNEGFLWMLISGLFILLLGIMILFTPIASGKSIAVLVSGFLFARGLARIFMALNVRPNQSWGWIMLDGVFTIALAALIAFYWPNSSLQTLGVLIGFSLIFAGFWRVLLTTTSKPTYNRLYDAR